MWYTDTLFNPIQTGKFYMLLLSSADFFFFKYLFSENYFRNTIRLSNGLDPDQDGHSVGPDLGPNCLKKVISRRQKFFQHTDKLFNPLHAG